MGVSEPARVCDVDMTSFYAFICIIYAHMLLKVHT